MKNPPDFRTGDSVVLHFEGRTIPGRIILASGNRRSLWVEAEAIIYGFVGQAPLLWMEDHYETLAGGEVAVEWVAADA
jgi:hypothetical protein